jgi:pyruvate/2-oxoglutarate dehydrogenase complex dihydrolipoamide dehydrogenase (E3) component
MMSLMQIAIVGSGVVARFFGQAFAAAGHAVTLGRHPR